MVCVACQFWKHYKCPGGSAKAKTKEEEEMEIKKGGMLSVQRISVDHYMRSVTGSLYISRGGYRQKNLLHGGMVFTNHVGGYVLTGHPVNFLYGESL